MKFRMIRLYSFKQSINEVVHTFMEAVVLVILVVYLFLQNMRATLIPILAFLYRLSVHSQVCTLWAFQ